MQAMQPRCMVGDCWFLADPQMYPSPRPLVRTIEAYLRQFNIVSIGTIENGMDTYQHICTGTLLNADVVLTAAHCVYDKNARDIFVLVGLSNYRSGSDRHVYSVDSYSHPGFAYRGYSSINDIALVFLKRCVDPDEAPVYDKLNNQPGGLGSEACTSVNTIGFGKHEQVPDRYYMSDGTLRVLEEGQFLHSSQTCSEAFVNYYSKFKLRRKVLSKTMMDLLNSAITPNHGCFGGNKAARDSGYSCAGDSGGPVYDTQSHTIIGVTSFTSEICGTLPNYFTVVGNFDVWIMSEIIRKKTIVCSDDYISVEHIFTHPIGGSEFGSPPRHLIGDESNMTASESVSYLVRVNNGTCTQKFAALNEELREPYPNETVLSGYCKGYIDCICDGDLLKAMEMADLILPAWHSDSLHRTMTETEITAASRLLLCTSDYKTYYESLNNEAAEAFRYFDMLSVQDTCNLITA